MAAKQGGPPPPARVETGLVASNKFQPMSEVAEEQARSARTSGVMAHVEARPQSPRASIPRLTSLADVLPEPVRWLWPNRIPLGKLTLLAGDPGLGKSFVTLDIAARISAGASWPDNPNGEVAPGDVVILTAEDDLADTVRPRLDAAGANTARIHALTAVKRPSQDADSYFTLEKDIPALERVIQEKRAVLVVIDPVTAYLGRRDSNSNSDIRGLLAPLAAIASRYKCAVIAVTHLNKNDEASKAIYRAIGSLAFAAAARVVWLVAQAPGDDGRRLMIPIKTNVIEHPDSLGFRLTNNRVQWEREPVKVNPDELLRGHDGPVSRIEEAGSFLLGSLSSGPLPSLEVKDRATDAGIAERTLERAKDKLGIMAKRDGYGDDGAWLWELPPKTAKPGAPDMAAFDTGAHE